jgi:hypothetical protein
METNHPMHQAGPPVIAFTIPLRPNRDPAVWQLTCRLLQQTLQSLRAQGDGRWMAVIAGHHRPEFLDNEHDDRVQFHEVDFDIDRHVERPVIDKSWKVAFASMKAAPASPSFHMLLDADDLVHRDFVVEIANSGDCPAVVFDFGWEFDLNFKRALPRNELSAICGSTTAYNSKTFPLPQGRGWEEWNKVPAIKVGHDQAKADLLKRGLFPRIPQRRLAAYLTGHASSLEGRHLVRPWRRRIGFAVFGKRISHSLREDFQLHW